MSDIPENPIFDTFTRRKTAEPIATLLDAAAPAVAPIAPTGPPQVAAPIAPTGPPQVAAPASLAHEMPTIGTFFAQHRALVDERRGDLARVGMLPEHARALAMPDLVELPLAPGIDVAPLPPANRMKFAMPKAVLVTDAAEPSAYEGRSDIQEE